MQPIDQQLTFAGHPDAAVPLGDAEQMAIYIITEPIGTVPVLNWEGEEK